MIGRVAKMDSIERGATRLINSHATTPAQEILQASFSGPFGWISRPGVSSVFTAPESAGRGLYLWTVELGSAELVYYVGQTGRPFSVRFREHLKEHLAGAYHVYDPQEFAQGRKIELWPGLYGAGRGSPKVIEELVQRYASLTPAISELAATYRFFLANVDWHVRLCCRAEASISQALAKSTRDFQDAGVRYSPRVSDELSVTLRLSAPRQLIGLPGVLEI